jgi:prepilin-type processing-associated H-X9-DG protein
MVYSSENDDYLPISFYMMPRLNDPSTLFYDSMATPYRAFRIFDVISSSAASYPENIAEWGVSAPNGNAHGWKLNGTKRMWGAGTLYYHDILDSGKSLYCPSIPKSDGNFTYATYSEEGPWPSKKAGSPLNNVLSSYYYMPQSKTRKITVSDGLASIEVPIAALKADDLDPKSVMSTDMMAANFLAHKAGMNNGVSALFADGHVVFSNKSEVFKHALWRDETQDINKLPAVLRTIIKGIEGKTQYMDNISGY